MQPLLSPTSANLKTMARGIRAAQFSASGGIELLVGTNFEAAAKAFNLTEADVKKAVKQAARKAATWAQKQGTAALAGITTIPQRELMAAVRTRMKPTKQGGAVAWFGLNDVDAKHEGAQQTADGVVTRTSRYPSAFIVEKLGGHVFKRRGPGRLPIDKQTHNIVGQMETALSRISDQADPIFLQEFFAQIDKVLGKGSGEAAKILLS